MPSPCPATACRLPPACRVPAARRGGLVLLASALGLALAGGAGADTPTFDASCLDDPRACLAPEPAAEAAPPEPPEAPATEEAGSGGPLVLRLERPPEDAGEEARAGDFRADPTPDDWKLEEGIPGEASEEPAASPPATGPAVLDRSGCIETSVRAGNGLEESQRVCDALFPAKED